MFSYGSSSSISFATVTPSVVMVGEPNFFVEDDVASARPERRFHCFREFLDAAQECLACAFVELELFSCHVIS
jgi:hypothetical protein